MQGLDTVVAEVWIKKVIFSLLELPHANSTRKEYHYSQHFLKVVSEMQSLQIQQTPKPLAHEPPLVPDRLEHSSLERICPMYLEKQD